MPDKRTRNSNDVLNAFLKISKNMEGLLSNDNHDCSWVVEASEWPGLAANQGGTIEDFVNKANLDLDWKQFFISLVAFKAISGHSVADSNLDALATAIKHLTNIASRNPVFATIVLVKNCSYLCKLSLMTRDPKIMDKAATTIRHAFRVTVTDYEDEESGKGRTLGFFELGTLLLRLYVRMHAYSLAEGILSAINNYTPNVAPLQSSPPVVQAQFLFYRGLFAFYDQKFASCYQYLENSLVFANRMNKVQFENVMVFQILAAFLVTNKPPSKDTWTLVPRLARVYKPIFESCVQGNYTQFMQRLERNADFLRSNRLYLACNLLIPKLKLNLLRRIWRVLGQPKRINVDTFAKALALSGFSPEATNLLAAEFYLSQLINSGAVKGYIHHELQLLMLSKSNPFPNLVTDGCVK